MLKWCNNLSKIQAEPVFDSFRFLARYDLTRSALVPKNRNQSFDWSNPRFMECESSIIFL